MSVSPAILEQYTLIKTLPDGRVCGVLRLLFHWTLHVDMHELGYEDRYCFGTKDGAEKALTAWNGEGDPDGWHRHPKSNRRRDPSTGLEWIAA